MGLWYTERNLLGFPVKSTEIRLYLPLDLPLGSIDFEPNGTILGSKSFNRLI